MTSESGSRDELRELLDRRPRGIRPLCRRYLMGKPTEIPLSKDDLRKAIGWDDTETEVNERRLGVARDELSHTRDSLRDQFQKTGLLISLFGIILGLLIALNPSGDTKSMAMVIVCIATVVAIWVQAPRLKIFEFRERPDSGLRIGAIKTSYDEYYHLYVWLNRREETLPRSRIPGAPGDCGGRNGTHSRRGHLIVLQDVGTKVRPARHCCAGRTNRTERSYEV